MQRMHPPRQSGAARLTLGLGLVMVLATAAPRIARAQTPIFEGHTMPVTGEPQLPATPPTSDQANRGAQERQPPNSQAAPSQAASTPNAPARSAGSGIPITDVPPPIAATPFPNHLPANRAEVSYSNGLIDVRANNSSLHQILRAISRRTGMTIVGGIVDDRVFGNYGPDTPSAVLATLVYGTGTNMLLRSGDATHPMELVLTPRTGDTSPVTDFTNSSADSEDEDGAAQVQSQPRAANATASPPAAARANNPPSGSQNSPPPMQPGVAPVDVNGSPSNTTPTASDFPTTNSVPVDSLPTPSTTPSSSGIVDSPNPSSSRVGTTGPSAPTPEQVYQQLLRLQQGQQGQQTNTNSGTSNPPQ